MQSKFSLTLIAAQPGGLDDALARSALSAVAAAGVKIIGQQWLAHGLAWDVVFTGMDAEGAEAAARSAIADAKVDVVVQEAGNRRKHLLVTDMDSTIITVECIDEIADFAGIKQEVAKITARAMNGELDFKDALVARVKLLEGLSEPVLQKVYDERVKFMPGARELVASMRANGAYCLLVSGGFTFFTQRVREALGFSADASNRLEIKDGKLTGRVLPPILDRSSKLQALIDACQQRGLSLQDALAIGDGANDVPMIMAAGLGVAYHAKPVVQKAARTRINHADLTALLYAQGYTEEEIVKT